MSRRLDLKSSNKNVTVQDLFVYYTWKNTKQQYRNNKLKIIAPWWNEESGLPDGFHSVSDIQYYIEHIVKKHETLPINPSIHIYTNRISNRFLFKIKDGYKLELQTLETMKLFCCTQKLIGKTKNRENVSSLEVVEVVSVQFNLLDNKYQQKSEVLYTFTPNKFYSYLINIEPRNLVFLKTYNTNFDDFVIIFTN